MERREQIHDVDHFGFDPVSPTTHTKNPSKEKNSFYGSCARDIRNLSYEVSAKLSFDGAEPHNISKSRNCKSNSPDSSFKLPDKDSTRMTEDFWGFDPAISSSQKSIALEKVPPQHNHGNKNTSKKAESTSTKQSPSES